MKQFYRNDPLPSSPRRNFETRSEQRRMKEGNGKCVQHETRLLFFCSSCSTHLFSALKSFIQTKLVSATALYLVCLSLSQFTEAFAPLYSLSFDPFPSAEDEAISARNCISRPSLHTPNFEQRFRWSAVSPFAQEEIRATHAVRRSPTNTRQTLLHTRQGKDEGRMMNGVDVTRCGMEACVPAATFPCVFPAEEQRLCRPDGTSR